MCVGGGRVREGGWGGSERGREGERESLRTNNVIVILAFVLISEFFMPCSIEMLMFYCKMC